MPMGEEGEAGGGHDLETAPTTEENQGMGPSHLPPDKIKKYTQSCVCRGGPLLRRHLEAHQTRSLHPRRLT